MDEITRRQFIKNSGVLAAGVAVGSSSNSLLAETASDAPSFASDWQRQPDRVWLGRDYWANPLRDWRLTKGRIEPVKAARDRNVQLLTRQLGQKKGRLQMSVTVGRVGGKLASGNGTAGFSVGVQGPLEDYRSALIRGRGLSAGLISDGRLFIGQQTSKRLTLAGSVTLRLDAEPSKSGYRLRLTGHDPETGKVLGAVVHDSVSSDTLVGNLALVSNFGKQSFQGWGQKAPQGTGRFWFADWQVTGDKVEAHEERAFGPILFSQYTLTGGVMKMTAQMPPLGEQDEKTVRLQVKHDGKWATIAEEQIDPDARTATFRVPDWSSEESTPYRLAYAIRHTDGTAKEHQWTGTIRREPTEKRELVVADISCNHHDAFPNSQYVANMAKADPDVLTFVGDQFYEGSGGYGIVRGPLSTALLDYLHHWNLHGLTWRDLMRDRPTVTIPDDHDVYQGNVWGESGAANEKAFQRGGYRMQPRWVNTVHRTQTAHLPDPYDPTPIKRNIGVYHTSMTYGGVSFAILADRMFKTGPEGVVPPTETRSDWVTSPDYDVEKADVPEAELLGERQLRFLREWATDWRHAEMKAVLSQTIFTAMATHHGGRDHYLVADFDSNAWPQTPRNNALREIRKCFAVHLAGDQHLPAVVHYGIDDHRDAGVAFAGPAVNVGYLRWFHPKSPGKNRSSDSPRNTGDFTDGFGHPMTVLAVHNPVDNPGGPPLERMRRKASGIGLARFDKSARRVTLECWPYLADPTRDEQCEGWPVEVDMLDNYGRSRNAMLPTLSIRGVKQPVIDVLTEGNELLYTLRAPGATYQPPVFEAGRYTVRVRDPEKGIEREISPLTAKAQQSEQIEVDLR